jgi:hypothetical protein
VTVQYFGGYTSPTQEALLVNSINMKTLVANVEDLSATLRVPPRKQGNIVVPGKHGTAYQPNNRFDENRLVWNMWVVGGNGDGSIPSYAGKSAVVAQRISFMRNLEILGHLFSNGRVLIQHTQPNGVDSRYIYASVKTAIDWSTSGSNPVAMFSVELVLHDPFWVGADPSSGPPTYSVTPAGGTQTTVALPCFNNQTGDPARDCLNATALCEDLVIKIVQIYNATGHDAGNPGFSNGLQLNSYNAGGQDNDTYTLTINAVLPGPTVGVPELDIWIDTKNMQCWIQAPDGTAYQNLLPYCSWSGANTSQLFAVAPTIGWFPTFAGGRIFFTDKGGGSYFPQSAGKTFSVTGHSKFLVG